MNVEMQRRLAAILKVPVISEKSTGSAEKDKTFAFKIDKAATKTEVKLAVELMFNVKVESVRVLNVKGKQKRFGRTLGQRSDWKKAYIKLKPGHDIDFSVV
ncbi:MAG: 50S ribosomal protein L23 [Methylococcaceae bacterium]|jgi:large subunit ribosomal protein L23